MRGAPQPRFPSAIVFTSFPTSAAVRGRPGFWRRESWREYRLNPAVASPARSRVGQSLMRTATDFRFSAGTPKTIGPVAESWDDERYAEIFLTAHAERDFPARLVYNRPRSGRSYEKESGGY